MSGFNIRKEKPPAARPIPIPGSGGGGGRREQSTSSAYSSDAWTGDTPQTPPSPLRSIMQTEILSVNMPQTPPSPLRSIMQTEILSFNKPSKDQSFSEVIEELHNVMMRDVQRRKSSQNKTKQVNLDEKKEKEVQEEKGENEKDDLETSRSPAEAVKPKPVAQLPLPPLLKLHQEYQKEQRQRKGQEQGSRFSFSTPSSSSNPWESPIKQRERSNTLQNDNTKQQQHRRKATIVPSPQQNRRRTATNKGQNHQSRNSSPYSNITDGSETRFLKSQLQNIKLTSILNRNLFGCKGENPRCVDGNCVCQASTSASPVESKKFVFRLRTCHAPPEGRRPIRISDGLNPPQPFDFSRFELPPRRKLYPFACNHIEVDSGSRVSKKEDVDEWLATWKEKNMNPFVRPAKDLQWQVRIQNREPVQGFKHPIFAEYDGCLTLPHVPQGFHYKDVRPGENKTLQESATWASNRPKAVMNDSVPSTPRHIRIFNQLGLHSVPSKKPQILNQALLGDLTQLRPGIYKIINGDRWSLDEKTLKNHPELWVFNPKDFDFGTPRAQRTVSSILASLVLGDDDDSDTGPKPEVLSFGDPRIKEIFREEKSNDKPECVNGTEEEKEFKKAKSPRHPWPMHFAILRSYQHPVNEWPEKNVLARGVQQRHCPNFDGKGGHIYLEEHTFTSMVDLLGSKDPLLAPIVQDVTAPEVKRWLELIEPAYTGFEGNQHIPMSPFIPTPRGFGRWAEFRYVPATGHWILYFFPKPHDWQR